MDLRLSVPLSPFPFLSEPIRLQARKDLYCLFFCFSLLYNNATKAYKLLR